MDSYSPPSSPPQRYGAGDQADGLRRLFGSSGQCVVPVASNPLVADTGVLLERLAGAFTALEARVLVVDAADNAPHPHELVDIDLPASIERLSRDTAYLAARGVPRRHVDARGSSEAWLSQVQAAAPWADVVLVHAEPRDLARLLGRREVFPVLMASLAPDSLTQAYAAMKLLSQRCGLMNFDLLVGMRAAPRRGRRVAERLASTADAFLGTQLREAAVLDADHELGAPVPEDLSRLAALQLMPQPLMFDPASRQPTGPAGAIRPSLSSH